MKITGTNIYLTTDITEAEVDILAACWDPYRYSPHSDRSKDLFFNMVKSENAEYNFTTFEKGRAFFVIKKKSDDTPIGYTHFKSKNNELHFLFSILLPSEQSKGYYSEMNILRHKFVYSDTSPISKTHIRKAKDTNTRHNGTLVELYSREEREESIAGKGEFIHSYITKDEWTAWIDASDQTEKKNATYILET